MRTTDLNHWMEETFSEIGRGRERQSSPIRYREKGVVKNVSAGVAIVTGLPGVSLEELLEFPNQLYGMAFNLERDEIGVILLGRSDLIRAGDPVLRTHRVADI